MEVYTARQPIFNRNLSIYGYELLYRSSDNNYYDGKDDNTSTAELIVNSFLIMKFKELTDGTRAFINFSNLLIENEIPFLLPKDQVVIEILESVEITDALIQALKKLKEEGYLIALDDFIFAERYTPLIELADIIKIEFNKTDIESQKTLLRKYHNKIKFLAEKVETTEEYEMAYKMGYDYFQGYFFSKPVVVKGKEINGLNTSLIRIVQELNKEEPEFRRIAEMIQSDIGLTYKFLQYINVVFPNNKNKTFTMINALAYLGIPRVKKWIYLMMFREMQNNENKELIKNCLIRGKLMELVSTKLGTSKQTDFYMTGLFSSVHILLNKDMEESIIDLPLDQAVKEALLGKENLFKETLDFVISHEKADWSHMEETHLLEQLNENNPDEYMSLYIEALKWAKSIDEFS